jgi:hypothetical protein
LIHSVNFLAKIYISSLERANRENFERSIVLVSGAEVTDVHFLDYAARDFPDAGECPVAFSDKEMELYNA